MGSKSLAGTGRPTLTGLLELPRPWCEPFRKMLAHPAVVHRLTWMGGKGFRCTGFEAICTPRGGAGHFLHGGNEPLSPSRNYTFQNGRSYALGGPSVGVAWQLRDVTAEDGGFACVPGSHKSQYGIPRGVWTCDEDMGLVTHPLAKAGDVIFFHGRPAGPRRTGVEERRPAPRHPHAVLFAALQRRGGNGDPGGAVGRSAGGDGRGAAGGDAGGPTATRKPATCRGWFRKTETSKSSTTGAGAGSTPGRPPKAHLPSGKTLGRRRGGRGERLEGRR